MDGAAAPRPDVWVRERAEDQQDEKRAQRHQQQITRTAANSDARVGLRR
jgi:hypothetical protein